MSIPLPSFHHLFKDYHHDNNTCNIHVNDLFLTSEERYEIYLVKAAERPHLLSYNPTSCINDTTGIYNSDENKNKNDKVEGGEEKKSFCEDYSSYIISNNNNQKKSYCYTIDNHITYDDPPLIDGCDIPGWRKENLASTFSVISSKMKQQKVITMESITINHEIQSLLNIGASSSMFRYESQWPNIQAIIRNGNYDYQWKALRHTLLNVPIAQENNVIVVNYNEYCQYVNNINFVEDKNDNGNSNNKKETNYNKSSNRVCNNERQGIQHEVELQTKDSSNYRKITKFAIEFEQKNIPAKILGATIGWKCMPRRITYNEIASSSSSNNNNNNNNNDNDDDESLQVDQSWTFENLVKRYGHVYWRFSDTHGEMMSMKTYAKYITNIEGLLDDSPLGIYDSEFGDEDSPTHEMIQEYTVPKCFSTDLFDLAITSSNDNNNDDEDIKYDNNCSYNDDEDKESNNTKATKISNRPPYRWVLIGPERSGTGLHVDPLWTNAWVTVIEGKKRWCLFPPQTPKELIGMGDDIPQMNSATWFHKYYDKVTSPDWPSEYKPVEVLQLPGETVFVPNGWPHLVLNLECTVAITHNYASEFGPFERMWDEVRNDEAEFANDWLKGMKETRYDLYQRMNKGSNQL